jgi:hypothetical protein
MNMGIQMSLKILILIPLDVDGGGLPNHLAIPFEVLS